MFKYSVFLFLALCFNKYTFGPFRHSIFNFSESEQGRERGDLHYFQRNNIGNASQSIGTLAPTLWPWAVEIINKINPTFFNSKWINIFITIYMYCRCTIAFYFLKYQISRLYPSNIPKLRSLGALFGIFVFYFNKAILTGLGQKLY